MMVPVKITDEMMLNARDKVADMHKDGHLKNSIRRGAGALGGFIGEQIALKVMGGKWANTYDYDFVTDEGTRVEVKTKITSVEPKPHYACSVARYNTRQDCDVYAFTRVMGDYSMGWFLGFMTKEEFYEKAELFKKGQVIADNNHDIKADCYSVAVKELRDVQDTGNGVLP